MIETPVEGWSIETGEWDADKELESKVTAYIFTRLRSIHDEPGFADQLGWFSNRFTPDQFEVVELLGGEVVKLFQALCSLAEVDDPVEQFERIYYKNLDWMPVGDTLDD